MAKLGTNKTDRIGFGRAELRLGRLNQAGKLTQAHSIGIVDKVDLFYDRQTVKRKVGTPQMTVATETVSADFTVTATVGESSYRNMQLLMNLGIDDYPTAQATALRVSAGIDPADLTSKGSGRITGVSSDIDGSRDFLAVIHPPTYDSGVSMDSSVTKAAEIVGDLLDATKGNILGLALSENAGNLFNVFNYTAKLLDTYKKPTSYLEGYAATSTAVKAILVDSSYTDDNVRPFLFPTQTALNTIHSLSSASANNVKGKLTTLKATITGLTTNVAIASALSGLNVDGVATRESVTFTATDFTHTTDKTFTLGNLKVVLKDDVTAIALVTKLSGLTDVTDLTTASTAAIVLSRKDNNATSPLFKNGWAVTAPTTTTLKFAASALGDKDNFTYNISTVGAVLAAAYTEGAAADASTGMALINTQLVAISDGAVLLTAASVSNNKAIISAILDVLIHSASLVGGNLKPNNFWYKSAFTAMLSAMVSVANLGDAATKQCDNVVAILDAVMTTTVLGAFDFPGRNTLLETFKIITGLFYDAGDSLGTEAGMVDTLKADYFVSSTDILTDVDAFINNEIDKLQTTFQDFYFNEKDIVVVYDESDPASCVVLEVKQFLYEKSTLEIQAAGISDEINTDVEEFHTIIQFTTPIGRSFNKEATVKIYNSKSFGAGLDAKTEYYTLQFVQLDAKTKAPRVLDVWKVSVDSGSTLSYTPTDFVNFDLVFNSSYPSATDTEIGGDLWAMRGAILGKYPLFRMVDVPSNFKV